MGTTQKGAAGDKGEKEEEKEKEKEVDFEQSKKDIHRRARGIVSRFGRVFCILNELCKDAEFPAVNANFPSSSLR
jgi:hypothetical protein